MIDLTPLEVRQKKGDFRRAMRGYEPEDLVGKGGITHGDVAPYVYPSDEDIARCDIRGIYMSNFFVWDAKRQGEITQTAFLLLGREAAIEFLNSEHSGLGGRPLDVATASDEGRNSVEAEIGRLAYAAPDDA